LFLRCQRISKRAAGRITQIPENAEFVSRNWVDKNIAEKGGFFKLFFRLGKGSGAIFAGRLD